MWLKEILFRDMPKNISFGDMHLKTCLSLFLSENINLHQWFSLINACQQRYYVSLYSDALVVLLVVSVTCSRVSTPPTLYGHFGNCGEPVRHIWTERFYLKAENYSFCPILGLFFVYLFGPFFSSKPSFNTQLKWSMTILLDRIISGNWYIL